MGSLGVSASIIGAGKNLGFHSADKKIRRACVSVHIASQIIENEESPGLGGTIGNFLNRFENDLFIVHSIHIGSHADLLDLVETLGVFCHAPCLVESGKEHPSKNGNYRNYDQKFNQGKVLMSHNIHYVTSFVQENDAYFVCFFFKITGFDRIFPLFA